MSGEIPRVSWSRHQVMTPVKVFVVSEANENAQGQDEPDIKNWKTLSPSVKRKFSRQGRGGSGGLKHLLSQRRKVAKASRKIKSADIELPQGESVNFVDIPEIPDSVPRSNDYVPRYVHAYLDLMYVSCLSPYNRDEQPLKEKSTYDIAKWIVQKVFFSYFFIMATWQSFNYTKYFALNFITGRKIDGLIDVGFFLFASLVHSCFMYLITTQQKKLSNMLKSWERLEFITKDAENHVSDTTKKMYYAFVTAYGIFSMLFSISKVILAQGIENWSLQELILDNSGDTAEGVFLWTSQSFENSTGLYERYAETLSPLTYFMGIKGCIAKICWQLQIDSFRNLIMLIVTVNKGQLMNLGRKLTECLSFKNTKAAEHEIMEKDLKCWEMYRETREVNMTTNDTFDRLIKLNHVNALMTFTYFWTMALNKSTLMLSMVFHSYNLAKIIYIYWTARKSSAVNETCEKWIRTLPCYTKLFRVGKVYYTRCVMLNELDNQPLGFGKGKAHVNDDFIIMFLGVAGTFLGVLSKDSF